MEDIEFNNDGVSEATNNTVYVCVSCGHVFAEDEESYELPDGESLICEDCLRDKYRKCYHCDDIVLLDDITVPSQYPDRNVCSNCLEDYSTCEDCGELVHCNDTISDDNICLCQSCYDNSWNRCESCSQLHLSNNMHEHHGELYCDNCIDDQESDDDDCDREYNPRRTRIVHDYGYKPNPIFRGEFNSRIQGKDIYYGFELEIGAKHRDRSGEEIVKLFSDKERLFYLKYDGSICSGNVCDGFEIVSHPLTLAEHRKTNWKDMLDFLIEKKYISHNAGSCGLHIHVSRSSLTFIEQAKIGKFIYENKNNVCRIARRPSCSYASMLNPKDKPILNLPFGNSRYDSVNYVNNNTIEMRMFKGTLKYTSFMSSLEFVDAVIHYVTNNATVKLTNAKWNEFEDYVSNSNYKFLRNYMKLLGFNVVPYIKKEVPPQYVNKVKEQDVVEYATEDAKEI